MSHRQKHPQQGMALIEVLVGMAILAIILIGSMRALGSNTDSKQAVTTRGLALISADNTMSELYMQRAWPNVGTSSTPCPQLNLPLVCEQRVSNSANPNFRRIDITVYLDEGLAITPEKRTKLAWLTALLPNIRAGNF
jgi:general secretion pathway protein I